MHLKEHQVRYGWMFPDTEQQMINEHSFSIKTNAGRSQHNVDEDVGTFSNSLPAGEVKIVLAQKKLWHSSCNVQSEYKQDTPLQPPLRSSPT
jgi:hypothetical protein